MGDRNNPIKFGPEWLRNLSRERTAASSTSNGSTLNNSNNQNTANMATGSNSGTPGPSGGGTTPTNPMQPNTTNNTNAPSKILLAKLRYGREEMLALYDRNSEAPPELKTIEMLYQPRGKPPSALNSTFEEDRDTLRTVAPIGSLSVGERFILGRGRGIPTAGTSEGRGRGRGLFVRQPTGRGSSWHAGNSRMPGYSGGADEDSTPPIRSWNNNTTPSPNSNRSTTEQPDWQATKMFRNKRPGSNTNWRQSTREDGDEWRSDLGRSRPQDKWDRDWGERAAQDKQQAWNSNRRTWGGDTNNDDNLPEWALEGSEACGGTFDASGAFHGYSNDDSNLPKSQESAYPLARSHTHGSCVRQKTLEEGSEEWWASEKAKKLSPKRFDAGDIKFKKTPNMGMSENSNNSSSASKSVNKEENLQEGSKDMTESRATACSPQPFASSQDNSNTSKTKYSESKTFDALMRSDINLEEASDERGNFQSVMITPNNSLRQMHQNIVSPVNEMPIKHGRKPGLLRLQRSSSNPSAEACLEKQHKTSEDKIVEDIFDMALEDKDMLPKMSISANDSMLNASNVSSTVLAQGLSTITQQHPQLANPLHMGLGNPMLSNQNLSMNQNIKPQGMPPSQPVGMTNSALNASLGLPILGSGNMGIPMQGVPAPVLPSPGMATPGMNTPGMGPAGMCAAGMGGGIVTGGMGAAMGTSALQAGMSAVGMQAGSSAMAGFPSSGLAGMSNANVGNNSLFMGQNSGNSALQPSSEIPMPNHSGQSNIFPMHPLQHSGSQGGFGNSLYSNMMQQNSRQMPTSSHNLNDQWYYEDPKKIIQGPFSSKDMYNWYRAGFFSPSLMVRRVCDAVMRPLGSYGPIVPFASPMDMMSYQMANTQHDNMMNSQQGLGLDVMNMHNMNMSDNNSSVDSIQFGSVGMMQNPPFGQPPMVDSLWGQPSTSSELMWIQQALNSRDENRGNNLSMFFWDPQPSAIASNSLLPEEIAKEMKTEDQILAQLRANQNMETQQTLPFMSDRSVSTPATTMSDDNYAPNVSATPNLEELQKLMQKETLVSPSSPVVVEEKVSVEQPLPDTTKLPQPEPGTVENKPQAPPAKPVESKPSKQGKIENEKNNKSKDSSSKSKNKKSKDEKKEEAVETKIKEKEREKEKEKDKEREKEKEKEQEREREKERAKEKEEEKNKEKEKEKQKVKEIEKENQEDKKMELKRSAEPSPSKSKKDEKQNKKELEKEKKEWIKEGFTLVKGAEKTGSKENKKKAEEIKVAEEAERKRKEEEKLVAEEEKKKKQAESLKKQQELQMLQQRQAIESAIKKAPWSAVANQCGQATNKDGLTLAEIQRLEREKKVEQIKEQQQMMQKIAQQQAATLAREQEMQIGLGWAKKKNVQMTTPGQSLAEIQAEARRQAMATAAAAAAAAAEAAVSQALDEGRAPPPLTLSNPPWGTSHNGGSGGGFWDTLPNQPIKPEKAPESPKITEPAKIKKKPQPVVTIPVKKEITPAADFENWCTIMLTPWSSKIDVPTFIGFLRDIESPYEVKDYVKCYLGDTKESSDFARQFLERRSKLLRVGMVTPSDDLCSPAMAVNPRTTSGSDYQEVKGKGKKTKKNKMLKVDARILGFSVTASQDRINVGDIDTA